MKLHEKTTKNVLLVVTCKATAKNAILLIEYFRCNEVIMPKAEAQEFRSHALPARGRSQK